MKFLRDRKEIAQKINIEHVPVLTVDLEKDAIDGYEGCYKGGKVNITGVYKTYSDMYCRCTVGLWGDYPGNENHSAPWTYKRISLGTGATCIQASFGLSDVIEDVEWSNARTVKPGDEVILFFVNKSKGIGCLRLMRIGDRVDPFCQTATLLHDIDE